jgi:hypothetical protein
MSEVQASAQPLFKHKLCMASMEVPSTLDSMNSMVCRFLKPFIYNGRVVPAQLPRNRAMRKDEHFRELASGHAMASSDMEGHVWRDALKTGVFLAKLLRAPIVPHAPLPLFVAGQSCIQWWASWFKTAQVPVPFYGKKLRPAWFSGEVMCHVGYQSIMYAGIQQPEMHCYMCY